MNTSPPARRVLRSAASTVAGALVLVAFGALVTGAAPPAVPRGALVALALGGAVLVGALEGPLRASALVGPRGPGGTGPRRHGAASAVP